MNKQTLDEWQAQKIAQMQDAAMTKEQKEILSLKFKNEYLTNQNKLLKSFLDKTCKILKAFKKIGWDF